MNKNYYTIIGAALLGGGAYYAYKKGLFGKGKPKSKEADKIINEVEKEKAIAKTELDNAAKVVVAQKAAQVINSINSVSNPNSFAGKVSFIQSEINVTPDGKPGPVTNKAFAAIYGLDKGDISPANIDYYHARVKAKNTLSAIKAAAQKEAAKKAAAVNVANDAKKFLELVNKGKYKATANKDFTANAYTADILKGVYVDIKEPRKFSKGDRFSYGQFSKSPRGAYVMWHKGGNPSSNILYAFNPADFLVTL